MSTPAWKNACPVCATDLDRHAPHDAACVVGYALGSAWHAGWLAGHADGVSTTATLAASPFKQPAPVDDTPAPETAGFLGATRHDFDDHRLCDPHACPNAEPAS